MDSLEAQLKSFSTGATSPADEYPHPTAEIEAKIGLYEQKIEQLSKLLNEEEATHRDLVEKLETKVEELQQAVLDSKAASTPSESLSPAPAVVVPINKSKIKILEQRIVEMTISLEENDKHIFDLGMEIDRLKVELNQVRVEADRVPGLESAIVELEGKFSNALADDSPAVPPMETLSIPSSDSDMKIAELERTVRELSERVELLKADKERLEEERALAVDELLVEPITQNNVTVVEDLKQRVSELEEALEISEMNRRLLRDNFARENEEKLGLQVELERMRVQLANMEAVSNSQISKEESNKEQEPGQDIIDVEHPVAPILIETPGGALISIEDGAKLLKVQQMQIETLNLELNTLRSLPAPTVQSPKAHVSQRGCFAALFSSRKSRR